MSDEFIEYNRIVWTPMWENGAKTSGDYEGTVQGGTDAQLLGRMGTLEECGLVCLFLAADATFCTGKTLIAVYKWNLKLKWIPGCRKHPLLRYEMRRHLYFEFKTKVKPSRSGHFTMIADMQGLEVLPFLIVQYKF